LEKSEIRKSKVLVTFLSLDEFREQENELETANKDTNINSSVSPYLIPSPANNTSNNGNNLQININKVGVNNNPNKQPHPGSARKKNESLPKEVIVENEEKQDKKSHTPVIDISKEAPKKMKILNVSQKTFNSNNTTTLNQYKLAKDKSTISPMRKGTPVLTKDTSASSVITGKTKQSINTYQSQVLKVGDDISTNNGLLIDEKKTNETQASKSPEGNSQKAKNMSFS
jgi:hypothetical protein